MNERSEVYGVEFLRGGSTIRAKSRRGVVLSAGAVGSPTILMRSGIGPGEVLKSFKVLLSSGFKLQLLLYLLI